MNGEHDIARVHAYIDGELAPAAARAFERHVDGCETCRTQLASLQSLRAQTTALPREIPPHPDLWRRIREQLTHDNLAASVHSPDAAPRHAHASHARGAITRVSILRWLAPLGTAAAAVLFATFAERSLVSPTTLPGWSVAAVAGGPRVGAQVVFHEAKIRVGQWLETDAASRAKVEVGAIGEVNVEPNSRLRLVGMAATDHRLELARGTLSAFIWAPPRLFFVDTPSATAVDLGCSYTLTVDDAGNGELHVSSGYVALEEGDRESIIGAGMMCLTRRGVGPGTPFAADAPVALRAALTRFDFEPGTARSALREVLANARAEDAATLWHLLGRTRDAQRADVFDALAQHAAPPDGVTRDGIVSGDAAMRRAWGSALGLHPY